jgi:hypothetical protein
VTGTGTGTGTGRRGVRGAARALASRPDLWGAALGAAVRLAPTGWWRRWPPDPLPDRSYWRFRMTTAYGGSGDAAPDPRDVIEFLEWCRGQWHRPRRVLR